MLLPIQWLQTNSGLFKFSIGLRIVPVPYYSLQAVYMRNYSKYAGYIAANVTLKYSDGSQLVTKKHFYVSKTISASKYQSSSLVAESVVLRKPVQFLANWFYPQTFDEL